MFFGKEYILNLTLVYHVGDLFINKSSTLRMPCNSKPTSAHALNYLLFQQNYAY